MEINQVLAQEITQLIESRTQDDWQLDKLCKVVGKSRSQVYRQIKATTGYSTTIFIRRIRLNKAYLLLQITDQSITHIAYEVGFSSLSFFSKSFVEVYGVPPSRIR